MHEFTNAFLLTYAALFPIINPVGNAPIILSLTRGRSDRERAMLARRVAFNSFFLMLGSILLGSHVLEFFGISLPVVRIGGGLVVTAFGWKLLNSGASAHADHGDTTNQPLDSFYPFTMPLTVGPGAISVAIALGSQRPAFADLTHLALVGGSAFAGLLALSAFILLCIGIQIIWHGYTGLMALPR